MSQDQPLEALRDGGGERNRAEVVKAFGSGALRHWHDGGGYKARWDSCLAQ